MLDIPQGKTNESTDSSRYTIFKNICGYNDVKEFVNVIEEQFCDFLEIFERMMGDAETLLYD